MSARDLILIGGIAGLGYLAYRSMVQGQGAPDGTPTFTFLPDIDLTGELFTLPKNPVTELADYFARLAKAENAPGDPYVKAKTSSASGLWQFTKATWERLGGAWGSDLSKAFGGLMPTVAEQNERIRVLTAQNAALLKGAGIAATNGALYAAHFLGPATAIKVLSAQSGALVSSIVGPKVVAANPFLTGMTVAGFYAWLHRKVG
jgi:hypothetical protein